MHNRNTRSGLSERDCRVRIVADSFDSEHSTRVRTIHLRVHVHS